MPSLHLSEKGDIKDKQNMFSESENVVTGSPGIKLPSGRFSGSFLAES